MAARVSSASWNPAFMPNSANEIDATSPIDTLDSSRETTQAILEHPNPAQDMPASRPKLNVADPGEGDEKEGSIPDNNGHPEIENLRDALSTSLASPGGVELDENPWHKRDTQRDVTEEKADFPSEGPSNDSKHLSTMSFARTVSHDVSWGEDDEVDPEWNLHRSDTDPFKFMAKSDRTNSFPAVPPTHNPGMDKSEALPRTQAGEIIDQVEQEAKDLFGDEADDSHAHFFSQPLEPLASADDFLLNFGHEPSRETADFGAVYGGNAQAAEVDESDARFEEELPLVQSSENNEENSGSARPGFNGFADDSLHDEDDFFAQASKNDDVDVPIQHLGRKSTVQVMESLNFQHQPTHDDIIEEVEMRRSQSPLEHEPESKTNGSVAVQHETTKDYPDHTADPGAESGEGDLAAKWAAALDDEFLADDDDDLLPDDDDQPDASAMDPSALFGSDDEGFLEDTEDRNTNNPFPSQNGHSRGSGSLSGAGSSSRPGSSSSAGRYIPAGANSVPPALSNVYAPSAPLLTDLSRAATAPQVSAASPYMAAVSNFQPPQVQRPELPKAQSFADKSKGGYHSPYDLPMDVTKPRKRVSMQQMNRAHAAPANIAPPRSSSMFTQAPPPSSSQSSSFQQNQSHTPTAPAQTPPIKTVRKSQSGFFEELPVSAKPKPAARHSSGLASPALSPYGAPHHSAPPPMGPATPHVQHHQLVQPPPPHQILVAPERVSPYASLPSGNVPVPQVASRYSPAPPQSAAQMAPPPVTQSRYSPAPTLPRQPSYSNPPPQPLPHQPRTSSPLAHFERHQDPRMQNSASEPAAFDRRSSSSGHESGLRYQHLPTTREVDENEQLSPPGKSYGELQNLSNQPMSPPSQRPAARTPPPPQGLASRLVNSPPKRATPNYAPQQASYGPPQAMVPPKRSQTQSPGSHFGGPKLEMNTAVPYQRPASVEVPTSPRLNISYSTMSMTSLPTRPRGFSQGLNYIAPTDGRELDDLQRWKGAPVFAWGVGGTIITSFPKDVPRYGMNQTLPMVVRSPGEVKVRNIKDIDPLQARLTSFPGPLKGKSKKKEVLSWLSSGIEILEQNATYLRSVANLSHEDKRAEERILLWKMLSVFIENDGILEGSPSVEKAVRAVLSPGIDDESSSAALYATGADLSGISHSSTAVPKADPVDPAAVDQLRKHLLRGEREQAVWEAVDKRLWAHAMLISNTVSRDLYKRVAQEFVQKEVKNIGDNTESLAALYQIFAGNFEDSIDELVPPSARAGFQMVSATNAAGPSKDALDGLDRWRETLGLVLSNRSADDTQALNALGKLLSGYGRAEAAHICFMFARSLSIFGGVDDPQASIVLVGSDQLRQPYDFDREMEPILLSEVFEYGMSLAIPASALVVSSPHLSIYKLQHAKILAECGYRDKALQYCEAIASSITSQTRRSPYHHNLLVSELEDLSKRLKQSPKDDSGSWISKPSIDKAKGSVWATFNKFVSGEGDDEGAAATNVGGANDIGPFARIAGGTPTISRSPSNSEIHVNSGVGANGSAAMPITKASSRYAPGAAHPGYEPQSATSYGSQPRGSFEERSSGEFRRYEPQRQMSDYRPGSQSQPLNAPTTYTPQTSSNYTPQSSYTPQGNSYEPSPYAPQTPITEPPQSNIFASPQLMTGFDGHQQSTPYAPSESSFSQPQPLSYEAPTNSYTPPTGSYEHFQPNSFDSPASNGYEPPSAGGYEPPSSAYEPPSYQPASMDDEPDSPVETRPKKKFMDDDDDDIPGLKNQPVSQEKSKAEKDREAEEAFRKAAEADGRFPNLISTLTTELTYIAQKAKEAPVKKGWGLTGWFGGGAKKEDMSQPAPNKAIRAKLGEESSFVYDPDLKRWVNKKAGAEQTEAKTAAPPPPRATGPPRTASAGPTSQSRPPMPSAGPPQQRAVSETSTPFPADEHPPLQQGGLAPPGMMRQASNGSIQGAPGTAPSSRPGTAMSSMSNASSIDDLLGPPVPRKASASVKAAAKKKKGRGYIDVMGEKPS